LCSPRSANDAQARPLRKLLLRDADSGDYLVREWANLPAIASDRIDEQLSAFAF
jgi:hypothetical protein